MTGTRERVLLNYRKSDAPKLKLGRHNLCTENLIHVD
jgi:hypothetical protein